MKLELVSNTTKPKTKKIPCIATVTFELEVPIGGNVDLQNVKVIPGRSWTKINTPKVKKAAPKQLKISDNKKTEVEVLF